MDPYLEDPGLWPDVHSRLINASSELLLAQLRPKYFVQIKERVYLADETDEGRDVIVPDIRIRSTPVGHEPVPAARGGIATAPGIEVDAAWTVEIREGRLAVLDRQQQRVVTVVEFLSPANKVKGSAGKRSYDEKKKEVISSETNLVEIDLLRSGSPLYRSSETEATEYMAQVWRWTGRRHRRFIWPMKLVERLPAIPVPVRVGDEDAALDLQHALNTVYERAGYDLRIDYSKDPTQRLKNDRAPWARERIAHTAT